MTIKTEITDRKNGIITITNTTTGEIRRGINAKAHYKDRNKQLDVLAEEVTALEEAIANLEEVNAKIGKSLWKKFVEKVASYR